MVLSSVNLSNGSQHERQYKIHVASLAVSSAYLQRMLNTEQECSTGCGYLNSVTGNLAKNMKRIAGYPQCGSNNGHTWRMQEIQEQLPHLKAPLQN